VRTRRQEVRRWHGMRLGATTTVSQRQLPRIRQASRCPGAKADDDQDLAAGVYDSRLALAYLLSRASDDYIAVMDVLEASVTDMTPAEVVAALAAGGTPWEKPRS
jgi:hypothetical protein